MVEGAEIGEVAQVTELTVEHWPLVKRRERIEGLRGQDALVAGFSGSDTALQTSFCRCRLRLELDEITTASRSVERASPVLTSPIHFHLTNARENVPLRRHWEVWGVGSKVQFLVNLHGPAQQNEEDWREL